MSGIRGKAQCVTANIERYGSSSDAIYAMAEELTSLRAFKAACEGQKPVAWQYELKAGEYTFAKKRYLDEVYAPRPVPLYYHPDPEAAQLRMRVEELNGTIGRQCYENATLQVRVKELEAQLAARDQQVAEACAAECEGIDAINSRGWGDVLAKRIRSGEWKKHMKMEVE